MRIVRARNHRVMDLIRDKMTAQSDEYVDNLKEAMQVSPDNVYVLVALEDEDVVAFVVGSSSPSVPNAWIHQAWRDNKLSPSVPDHMFMRFVAWVEEQGKDEIRAETKRNADALWRKWGFEPIATILSFNLTDQEGVYNGRSGREERDQNQEHDLTSAGSGEQGTGFLFDAADREG